MRIINHHTEPIHLEFYKGDEIEADNAFAAFRIAIEKRSLQPEESYERGMGYDDVQIGVSTTYGHGRYGLGLSPTKQRRFLNTTLVLFTVDRQTRMHLIDWPATQNAWKNKGQAVRNQRGDDSIAAKGLAIGAAVLGGLVTGIAATGPVGAVPAGVLLVGGSLLLMAFSGELLSQGTASLDEIETSVERIVTDVVRDQLSQFDARKAAARIIVDTRNLFEVATLVAAENAEDPNRSQSHYEDDLSKLVESAVYGGGGDSLSFWLETLHREPDTAKFILPLYMMGIGTWLQLQRMHLLQAACEPVVARRSPVTKQVVGFYQGKVAACRKGLEKALEALDAYRDKQMDADGSLYVPEGSSVREIFYTMYLGEPTANKVQEAIRSLQTVETRLDEDMKADRISNFWRPEWTPHLPHATP